MADPCPSIHPASLWWKNSVEKSFVAGWLAKSVWKNRNSRRYVALLKFRNRWRSDKIICDLPDMVIFTPSEGEAGHVNVRTLNKSVWVYLAPMIEFDSQADCDFTVAHELAHIELSHYLLPADERGLVEIEADAQAEQWGFPKRKRGKRIFSRLTERSL